MITNRGLRFIIFILLIASALAIAGCGEKECVEKQVKYYEQEPVTKMTDHVEQESYTYEQPSVEVICGRDFEYEVRYEDSFWLDEKVLGEPNQVKRTVYIKNFESKVGQFTFDILHLGNGKIIDRSLNPSKTLVSENGERRLFLAWYTDYAPGKDIQIDVIDVPQIREGMDECRKIIKYTNQTGVRDNVVTTETTSYENVIKTKTVTVCN